jgi:phage tail sheath gpL-like
MNGVGAPDITGALATCRIGHSIFINPYDDTTSLNVMKEFLSDTGGRWAWDKQLYGHSFGTTTGTYAQLGTKGECAITSMRPCWA